MSGSNGLSPIEVLADRQKCPEAPTKKKYRTTDEAWTAARERREDTGLDIAPYACSGCGYYHLTKKVTGSDTLTRQTVALAVTGAQRKSNHPVFARVPERVTLPEPETPPVPGDRDTRLRAARALVAETPEPTSAEVRDALACSNDTARDVMRLLGYENTKGRNARWVKRGEEHPALTEPEIGEEARWVTLDLDRVAHMPIGDLVAAYRLVGIDLRIQVTS